MLFFLPFFGQKANGSVQGVHLLSLAEIAPYLKSLYFVVVICIIVLGVLTLALQNCEKRFWAINKSKMSLFLNSFGAVLFVVSLQPYAATMLLVILAIKVLLLINKQ